MKFVLVILFCWIYEGAALAAPTQLGQWVWTRSDWVPYKTAKATRPDLIATVHIATLSWDGAKQNFKIGLALSPISEGALGKNVVVRIDDTLHHAWRSVETAAVAKALDDTLARLNSFMVISGPQVAWQLDYDFPVSALSKWAETIQFLQRDGGALNKHNVWITTLVSHVLERNFDRAMNGIIQGHILQIFDTGISLSNRQLSSVEARLTQSHIPFALGIAAFRRVSGSATSPQNEFDTQMEWVKRLSRHKSYRATWVFPAGQSWSQWIGVLP